MNQNDKQRAIGSDPELIHRKQLTLDLYHCGIMHIDERQANSNK